MKVLVTGASGFIGQHLIRELLKRGHHVIATSTSRQKVQNADWLNDVVFVEHRIGEEIISEDLWAKFHCPDLLIHLAWQGLPDYKNARHSDVFLNQHCLFIRNLILSGLKDISIIGTCFEYGIKNGCLDENISVEPVVPYAIAKNSLRLYLEGLKGAHEFVFKWIRLFYMYGEGQNEKSLLVQLKKAVERSERIFNMSGGEQVRDYFPVQEVAKGIADIALQSEVTGIFNCSSNRPVKLKDFVKNFLNDNNFNIDLNFGYYPYPDYEPMEFWGDNSKLKSILSYGKSN
ncbi:MAG: NAD(P)-dependent oxidoreductase [Chitinophagaceae bacterium]|nr:NAD(P)-dependent oxidoreductase [Chitinophagaceae bacterium]